MPIDDLPMHFANSLFTATDTIIFPADAEAQWDMLRWAKSRGGVLIADVIGSIWMRGGNLTLDTANFTIGIAECEGYSLEEVNREERVAMHAIAAATTLYPERNEPVLIMFFAERGVGRIAMFPLTLPSATRNASYMEVPEEAGLGVPLFAAIFSAGANVYEAVHDLRVPPYGIVYQDHNDGSGYFVELYRDVSEGWTILRDHRIWWYASAGATFEVTCTIGALVPVIPAPGHANPASTITKVRDAENPIGANLNNGADYGVQRKMSIVVNQQLMSGGNTDAAGVEVLYGVTESVNEPMSTGDDDHSVEQSTARQVMTIRMVFTSAVNAVHDICPAVYLEPGENFEYNARVEQPQIWVRRVMPAPQFDIEDA